MEPKVFVSYVHSQDRKYMSKVNYLINFLKVNKIQVIDDRGGSPACLRFGHSQAHFMEQLRSSDINYVLIMCSKEYTERALQCNTGVGKETLIIESEILGKPFQEKFVPIITECDENGAPCLPGYLADIFGVDLREDDQAGYKKIIAHIFGKPYEYEEIIFPKRYAPVKETNIVACPNCNMLAYDMNAIECTYCGYQAIDSELAENFITKALNITSENYNEGDEYPLYNCPECDSMSLVRKLNGQYFCFSCQSTFEYDEITRCEFCGFMIYAPEKGEAALCDGCFHRHDHDDD